MEQLHSSRCCSLSWKTTCLDLSLRTCHVVSYHGYIINVFVIASRQLRFWPCLQVPLL